jgi:hypothetical protein
MKNSDMGKCTRCDQWMLVDSKERLLIKIFGTGPYCKQCQEDMDEEWDEE